MADIESADYHLLLKLFAESNNNENKTTDGFDFIAQFLSPEELQQLEHRE